MRLTLIVAALALAVPASAEAGPSPDAGARLVCRPAAAPLGSRVKKPKTCRAASEWQAIAAAEPAGPPLTIKSPQTEPGQRTRPQ